MSAMGKIEKHITVDKRKSQICQNKTKFIQNSTIFATLLYVIQEYLH